MSTTIRVLKGDKERLERLAKRLGEPRLTDALRAAIQAAEREAESFKGDLSALGDAVKYAKPISKRTSENIDEELAKSKE